MDEISFRVYGQPRPQGSKRAFTNPKTGKPIIVEQGGANLKTWKQQVAIAARENRPEQLIEGPIAVTIRFFMPKPKKPQFDKPAGRVGDVDKQSRLVFDTLTGVIFRDDAQVTTLHAFKEYETTDEPIGCEIQVIQDT